MALKSFIMENAATLKVLRPPPPRAIGVPLRVLPRSKRYTVIGTAFDYFLRFEIKRRAPHAVAHSWAASTSLERLFRQMKQSDGSYRSLIPDEQLAPIAPMVARDSIDDLGDEVSLGYEKSMNAKGNMCGFEIFIPIAREAGKVYHPSLDIAYRVGQRALHIIDNARATYNQFIERREVSQPDQEELARCCLLLARIDVVLRAGMIDSAMLQTPEPDDIGELIDLLGVVPFDSLLNQNPLILNPHFGKSSSAIGGADSDLIAGGMLIDFKTTKDPSVGVQSLDQLLGYYLLCRNELTTDPTFPEITHLGLYFSRHGFLWLRPVSQWLDNPKFADVEDWFRTTALVHRAPTFKLKHSINVT